MKNTDIDNVVRKHKAILGLPQGFGKKPVAEKIKILNTKARSKNVALKGFVNDYNELKAKQGAGSKVGGKGGKGGATKTGKMVKDYKKPITEKKGMKAKPKPPPPKKETTTKPAKPAPKKETKPKPVKVEKLEEAKPSQKVVPKKITITKPKKLKKSIITIDGVKYEVRRLTEAGTPNIGMGQGIFDIKTGTMVEEEPDETNPNEWVKKGRTIHEKNKKPEPDIDEEIKKLSQSADKEIAKKKAAKKASTAERVKEKKKPRGPRPGKVADPSKKKVKEPIEELIDNPAALKSFVSNIPAVKAAQPKEGVAGGSKPVPTIQESSKAESNVFNLDADNLISSPGYAPAGAPEPLFAGDDFISSPGYAPMGAPAPIGDFKLDDSFTQPTLISGFRPKARKAKIERPKSKSGIKTTTISDVGYVPGQSMGIPGQILDEEGNVVGVVPGSKADRAKRLFSFTPSTSSSGRLY
tara:strand:+ start:6390 stop:7790 length:1401 start_codon:yes stop_codon:yes gene_type:complete